MSYPRPYHDYLSKQQALKAHAEGRLLTAEAEKAKAEQDATALDSAQQTVIAALMATQQDAKEQIEEIVSLLLKAVFGDEHAFEIEYTKRRDNSEADFFWTVNGERREFVKSLPNPGGVSDVCSLGLRIALWALASPRTAPLLLCDEPIKYLHSEEAVCRLGTALKSISEELKLQVIFVGQDDSFSAVADKTYRVTKQRGESIVEEMK